MARHDELIRLCAAGDADGAAAVAFDTWHSLDTDATDRQPTDPRSDHAHLRLPPLPADLRAEPGAPARPAHRPPRRRADLGQARGLQRRAWPTAATRPASSSTSSPTRSPRAPTPWSRIGGYQSNHTRQVAAVAAKLGLKAVLVQENWVDWPDCVNDRVGNILLSRIMGAEVRLDPAGFGIGFKDSLEPGDRGREGARAARRTRSRPAPPTTGSAASASRTGPTRSQQQEARARRLLRHHRRLRGHRLDPRRDDRRLRRARTGRRRVIGIDASAKLDETRDQVARIAREHRRADRPRPRPARRRDHRARGLGRRPLRHPGRSPPSTRSGSPASSRAMIIDPVYEGKSMAGLIDLVTQRRDPPRLHTCSTPTSAASRR